MLATTAKREMPGPTEEHPGVVPDLPLAVECLISARTADAVFVLAPDYRIVHWDPQAETLTGLLAEEMVDRQCHESLRGECEGGGRLCAKGCPVMALARLGRAVPSYDMRIQTRVGGKRWVNVSVLCVDSEEGPYLVHLLRDAQGAHETLEMARDLVRLSSGREVLTARRENVPGLTPRQAEVLTLLAAGKSAREIGRELYLSQATVRNHIRALLLALGAHSQLEALAKAREAGLLAG
ncbi:MAG: LuxR C-terminal-related transcriptional regulator [Rubrobacter sp.]